MTNLDDLLSRFKAIANGDVVTSTVPKFERYAVSNFRGGIGKSTLAFNLSWELSRQQKTLLLDVCPQSNFTQSLLGEDALNQSKSIYDALLPYVMAGTPAILPDDLIVSVPPSCLAFKGGKSTYLIPGSKELFLFPSLLYTQLSTASTLGGRSADTSKNILESLSQVVSSITTHTSTTKTLIDTSPFFGGATHLSWVAADAIIIPVRVDQHSMEALKLTLSMLKNESMDYLRLNKQAGIPKKPKVHSIVMTHCGWSRSNALTPDRSTQAYLSQVIEIVKSNADLFASSSPIDSIHLLDDFHSAGRISGTKRIPLAQLREGETHTIDGQRLEVNKSITRYQRELKALASSL
jgi:chromosome partitioning protein